MKNTEKGACKSLSVVYCVKRCIAILEKSKDSPYRKAMLAKVRNSVGLPYSRNADLLELIYENLPEDIILAREDISSEEKSIITALQMYALYNQGDNYSSADSGEGEKNSLDKQYRNIGTSLRALRRLGSDNTKAVDRRFNALITAGDYDELVYHLRHMLKLLKAKTSSYDKVDFSQLAQDLYWFDGGREERIRLSWAREYYRREFTEKDEKETKENDE